MRIDFLCVATASISSQRCLFYPLELGSNDPLAVLADSAAFDRYDVQHQALILDILLKKALRSRIACNCVT